MTTSPVPAQPRQLRDEIEQTRAELGGTVEALAAKTDVKTRAKQALTDATGTAKARVSEVSHDPRVRRAAPPAAIAAGVAAVLGAVLVVTRRRRAAAQRARLRPMSWLARRR